MEPEDIIKLTRQAEQALELGDYQKSIACSLLLVADALQNEFGGEE
jgi:hypothetical protein